MPLTPRQFMFVLKVNAMPCHFECSISNTMKKLPLCRWWKNSLHHWTTEGHPSTSTSYNCCEWSLYVYDCHWKTLLTTKWQDWLCNILQLHHTSTSCKFWRNVQEHTHYLHHIKEDTSYVNLPDNNFYICVIVVSFLWLQPKTSHQLIIKCELFKYNAADLQLHR